MESGKQKSKLILEDGSVFYGYSFGYKACNWRSCV